MELQENPVRSVILTNNGDEDIFVRAVRKGEGYPTHTPVRILLDRTVHLVQKCNVIRQEMALRFEPETNWEKCPYCGQKNWSVWMPVPIRLYEIWDGKVDQPAVYTALKWYILCLHCATIVANHTGATNPYALSGVQEYVYDPADDIEMRLWPEKPPARRRRSSSSPHTT